MYNKFFYETYIYGNWVLGMNWFKDQFKMTNLLYNLIHFKSIRKEFDFFFFFWNILQVNFQSAYDIYLCNFPFWRPIHETLDLKCLK